VEEVVTKTLEAMPDNSSHCSTQLMTEKTGLSQTAIVRIWRALGLQPHRVENSIVKPLEMAWFARTTAGVFYRFGR
jgi:hypothetical protein